MVKGMLYKNPSLAIRNKTVVADKMATHIYHANHQFEILDITDLDDLKQEVRDRLLDFTNNNGTHRARRHADRHRLGHILQNSFPKRDTEEARQMSADAARILGRIEGVRTVLTLQLEQRFGNLPSSAIETLNAANDLDQLMTYLERLTEAGSLSAVIKNSP